MSYSKVLGHIVGFMSCSEVLNNFVRGAYGMERVSLREANTYMNGVS